METKKDYIGTQFSDADFIDDIKVDKHTGRQAMQEEHARLSRAEDARNAEKERLARAQEEADKKEFEEFKKQKQVESEGQKGKDAPTVQTENDR